MDDDDYGAEFDQMVSETDKKVQKPAESKTAETASGAAPK